MGTADICLCGSLVCPWWPGLKDVFPPLSFGSEDFMTDPSTCILHQLGTPILYPHSLWPFQTKGSSFPLSSRGSLTISFILPEACWCFSMSTDQPFGDETCSGYLWIWHSTFYARAACALSVLVLAPRGDIPLQILSDDPQGLDCPDVAYRVAALVGWPGDGVGRAWAPHVVGKGRVGLQSMANKKHFKGTG